MGKDITRWGLAPGLVLGGVSAGGLVGIGGEAKGRSGWHPHAQGPETACPAGGGTSGGRKQSGIPHCEAWHASEHREHLEQLCVAASAALPSVPPVFPCACPLAACSLVILPVWIMQPFTMLQVGRAGGG